MKRLAAITAVALLMVIAVVLSWRIQGVLIALLLSLVVAASVRPLADWLVRRRLPRALAVTAIYLVGALLVTLLVYLVGAALLELPDAADRFCVAYDAQRRAWGPGIGHVLPASRALLHELGNVRSGTLALGAVGLTARALTFVVLFVVTAVLSLHWSGGSVAWTRALPRVVRTTAVRRVACVALGRAGAQLRWALVESALCGATLALVFRLLGLAPWALPAAGVALALRLPFVGPVVAVALVVIAAAARGPVLASIAALLTALVVGLARGLFARRLLGQAPEPLIVIVTALLLGSAAGLAGLLVAPAVAAVVTALARRWPRVRAPVVEPVAQLREVDERLEWIRRAALQVDPPAADEVRALLDRLHHLAGEAELRIRASRPATSIDSASPSSIRSRCIRLA